MAIGAAEGPRFLAPMSSTPAHVVVAGRVDTKEFHQCRVVAEGLASSQRNVTTESIALTETEWESFAKGKSAEFGVKHVISPMIWYNTRNFLGGPSQFLAFARDVYKYTSVPSLMMMNRLAKKSLVAFIEGLGHTCVFFDVSIGGSAAERVVFELFDDVCPRTCANFVALCEGSASDGATYAGTPFHRVVPGGWVQGGDVLTGSGDGSKSSSGSSFPDECFAIQHDAPGVLSMANSGEPHSNGSQFFVTLAPLPWLDCKRVAFGRIISGLRVLRLIGQLPLNNERPVATCQIMGCGVFTGESARPARYQVLEESKAPDEGDATSSNEAVEGYPTLPVDTRRKKTQSKFMDLRRPQTKRQSLAAAFSAVAAAADGGEVTKALVGKSADVMKHALPNHAEEMAWICRTWAVDAPGTLTEGQFVFVGLAAVLSMAGGRTL